jgi:DNA-binding NarL/FixJ family response regulator
MPEVRGARLRIVIAEDSAMIRAGLVEILTDHGHEIAAAVGDAGALRFAVAEHRPDVAIVDVRMPPGHTDEGLRAAIAIRRDRPAVGILVFSQYVETRYAADLLGMRPGAGAAGIGYLLKDRVANVGEFTEALSRVAAGGTALDPEVVADLLTASRHGSSLADLTGRERDVLALMAEGRSNSGIADLLQQHLRQARPAAGRRRPPQGARGARLPSILTTGAPPLAPATGQTRWRAASRRSRHKPQAESAGDAARSPRAVPGS